MNTYVIQFLYGASVTCCTIASLFFLRFWRRTRDRLFVWFAVAFALLAAHYIALAWTGPQDEVRTAFYTMRVIAFVLILVGIVEKNRAPKPR